MIGDISAFIDELKSFANVAEATLKLIEQDLEGNKSKFSVFSEKMFTIRGTAQQLELPVIAELASLAEEIALKGAEATTRPQVRKCVGALWDALTTLQHLLQNNPNERSEEEQILENRLQATLRALGGAREKVSEDDIASLLKSRNS